MTLSATVAKWRNMEGHLALRRQKKITKIGENNPFSNPCFSGKKIM
jgi:hypothetical protein